MITRPTVRTLASSSLATLVLLSGCGGGGSDGDASAALLTVPPGDTGAPAAEVDDATLLRNAARHIGEGIDLNVVAGQAAGTVLADRDGALAAFAGGATLAASVFTGGDLDAEPLFGAVAAGSSRVPFDDGDASVVAADASDAGGLVDETGNELLDLVAASLEDRDALVVREANRLTIDPDDANFCARVADGPFALEDCLALVPELRVTLDAERASSGIVDWQYRGASVLRVAFAPGAVDYELSLDGYATVLRDAAVLDGSPADLPDRMEGGLRFAARIEDAAVGAERGRVSLGVTRALRIEDAGDGTRFSLNPSTLYEIGVDAATGDASFEVSIGALSWVLGGMGDDGESGGVVGSVLALTMAGFELDARLNGVSGVVEIARIGLGGAPLALSLDARDLVRYHLADTSLRIDADGDMRFDAALDAGVEFIVDPDTGSRVGTTWRAPAGTVLGERRGLTSVEAGGPLTFESFSPDAQGNLGSVTLAVPVGGCIDERFDGEPRVIVCP